MADPSTFLRSFTVRPPAGATRGAESITVVLNAKTFYVKKTMVRCPKVAAPSLAFRATQLGIDLWFIQLLAL